MTELETVEAAKRGAFLGIGVGTYDDDTAYPKLNRAVPDVEDLARELKARGYETKVIVDPSSSEANKALATWRDRYTVGARARRLMMLWAGHAVTSRGKFLLIT